MPQLSNVVLKDNTLASHTFAPRDLRNGTGSFVEGTGIPIGDRKLTVGLTRTAGGRIKPTVRIVLPVVTTETVSGQSVSTVRRTAYVDMTFNFADDSTLQERKDAKALAYFALDDAYLNDVITGLQDLY